MSRVERLGVRVGSAYTIAAVLGAAVVWLVVNAVLPHFGIDAPDPFPFRWLQRVSIIVNVTLIGIVFCARNARRARTTRERAARARAQQALVEQILVEAMRAQTPHVRQQRH